MKTTVRHAIFEFKNGGFEFFKKTRQNAIFYRKLTEFNLNYNDKYAKIYHENYASRTKSAGGFKKSVFKA